MKEKEIKQDNEKFKYTSNLKFIISNEYKLEKEKQRKIERQEKKGSNEGRKEKRERRQFECMLVDYWRDGSPLCFMYERNS